LDEKPLKVNAVNVIYRLRCSYNQSVAVLPVFVAVIFVDELVVKAVCVNYFGLSFKRINLKSPPFIKLMKRS